MDSTIRLRLKLQRTQKIQVQRTHIREQVYLRKDTAGRAVDVVIRENPAQTRKNSIKMRCHSRTGWEAVMMTVYDMCGEQFIKRN